ncbi:hypothetical protein [Mycobacterium sp. P7213]|uniref:hypothetical protein n=1 Tax=Mycobacterium sp. P7213 TaxID=2478465 RepID=UPI000F641192|nr:hypothetical protein [Mycobacterium sp. P7213]
MPAPEVRDLGVGDRHAARRRTRQSRGRVFRRPGDAGRRALTHWDAHRVEELEVAWEEIWEDVKQYRWRGDNPAQAAALDERHAALLANRERPAEPHETSEVLG